MKLMDVEPKGEVFHRSPAMHWEIFPTRHSDAVIHRVRSISMKHTYAKVFRHAGKDYIVCCGVWPNEPQDSPSVVPRVESVEYSY